MPVQATIAITPGSGQLLDAVSLTVGANLVVRETMVIADPTNPTSLATVTAGGALTVTDPVIEACITANVLAVSLPSATIVTLTPPTAAAIAAAIVANPPAVSIATLQTIAVTNAGVFAVQDTASAATGGTPAAVSVGVTSGTALALNAARKGLILVNTSNNYISLAFGANAAVLYSGITLNPNGGTFEMDAFSFTTGAVNAIASGATSNLAVQEWT